MENKENYNKIITDLSTNIDLNEFYKNITSTNVISTEDMNDLLSSISFCIESLSSICTE